MIVPAVCFPIASACATLVGQALGAGDVRRAWRTVGVGILVHGSLMWSFAAGILLFRVEILSFFSDDAEVIRIGAEYLLYASGAFTLWAFFFVFMRALQGAGDVIPPMVVSLGTTFGITIPLSTLLAARMGPTGIWTAFLLSSAISTLGTGLWLATGRWTRRARRFAPLPGPGAPPEPG
jgi:Na+-driven multidrug efflux pump